MKNVTCQRCWLNASSAISYAASGLGSTTVVVEDVCDTCKAGVEEMIEEARTQAALDNALPDPTTAKVPPTPRPPSIYAKISIDPKPLEEFLKANPGSTFKLKVKEPVMKDDEFCDDCEKEIERAREVAGLHVEVPETVKLCDRCLKIYRGKKISLGKPPAE